MSPLTSTAPASAPSPRLLARPVGTRLDAMVWVPGDQRRGVDGFWIDRFPVTNAAFARFVDATGHVTRAERAGASLLFHPPRRGALGRHRRGPLGWARTPGADWRHPRGPGSSRRDLDGHPVVHVARPDVMAYAAWDGKAVPTEAEWEWAARGGLDGAPYPWGDELEPGGRHMANVWQGEFPRENRCLDGFAHTSPLRAFPPNAYGVFDMVGNVWEWTADPHPGSAEPGAPPCHPEPDPDPDPGAVAARMVLKGGSHLCGPGHCAHHGTPARVAQPGLTPAGHVGFRCVVRLAPVTPGG